MTRTERVARAIANAMDVDPDVFIGMHGRAKWEKQWLPIATAALTAIDAERDALREALDDARADVQYVLDELLPKHSPVLVATKLTLLRDKLDQARSLSSVSREGN